MELENAQTLLKEKQKELKQLIKPIQSFLELKFSENIAWFEAQKQLRSFPSDSTIGDWKAVASEIVDLQVKQMESNFNLMKTTFLRFQEQRGTKIRETAGGWRVGSLLIEMHPQNMSVRFCYNRKPVTTLIKVTDAEQFNQAYTQAESLLQKAEVELSVLTKWLWVSYQKALIEAGKKTGERVYVSAVADEFASKAVRDSAYMNKSALGSKNEYPRWAFLYNLDRYRSHIGTVPAHIRIGLQTGSQQESNSGEGMTINGLSADDDYKTICHVISGTANG